MLRVLRVSPAPLGAHRRGALEALFGPDVEVVTTTATSTAEVVGAAAGCVAVVLDCVRGVDPLDVAATGTVTLRPAMQQLRNRRGGREAVFSHYVRVAADGSTVAEVPDRPLTTTG